MSNMFPSAFRYPMAVSATVGILAALAYSAIVFSNSHRGKNALYTPLSTHDHSTAEIRLLHILPGSKGHRIEATLEVVPLCKAPEYEALSYTWGDPLRPRSWTHRSFTEDFQRWRKHYIDIDGHLVRVTYNLHAALQQLRHETRTRILWIDALCINQEDAKEKSRQVQLMGEVYSGASRVLCWLGEKHWLEGLDDMTFDAIEELVFVVKVFVMKLCAEAFEISLIDVTEERLASFIDDQVSKSCSDFPMLSFLTLPGMSVNFKKALLLVPIDMEGVSTIEDLVESNFGPSRLFALRLLTFDGKLSEVQGLQWRLELVTEMFQRRNYWSRVWILQEMLKAKEATLICEDRQIDIRPLLLLRIATKTNPDGSSILVPGLDAVATTWLSRAIFYVNDMEFFRVVGPLSMGTMITSQSIARTSSDPRDAIYGLLGICNPIDIIPDYSKTAVEVFIDATRKIIHQEGNLDTICLSVANTIIHGEHFPGYHSGSLLSNLPSWVPHFESALCHNMMANLNWRGNGPISTANNSPPLNDDRILSVDGCFFAIVKMVNSRGRSPHPIIETQEWLKLVDDTLISFKKHGATSELNADLIWRTLLMDFYEDDSGSENRMDLSNEAVENYKRDLQIVNETREAPTRFENILHRYSIGKSLCLLDEGFLALVWGDAKVGDLVFVARGATNPFIVRSAECDTSYTFVQKECNISSFYNFVGGAFVRGIMDGQAIYLIDIGKALEQRIYLV